MLKHLTLALPFVGIAQFAAAEITVETYQCNGGEIEQIADSVLDTYNSDLWLNEYGRPSDSHIVLRTDLPQAIWATIAEAEAFCAAPTYVESIRCAVNGEISVSRVAVGDIARAKEYNIDRFAPEHGQRIYIDQTSAGRWTSESNAQLDEICVQKPVIEITKYFCTAEGTLNIFTQSGTAEQLTVWNYMQEPMPAGVTAMYYDTTTRQSFWSVLTPDEMGVMCAGADTSPVEDGQWEMTMSDFSASADCPAAVSGAIQEQVAGLTKTMDIVWPARFSLNPMFPDTQAMGSWEDRGDGNWSLLVNRLEMNDQLMSLVVFNASIESPTRITWENNIQQGGFGVCQVIVTGELNKIGG
ncbi:hypothetical protein [Yoonia sp. 208BN28-4]|uniref:hypothetical protein n=1 Tax=Yoonia sp. 208BN28-4 TaxID=3126505 RepID=UPI0030AA6E70